MKTLKTLVPAIGLSAENFAYISSLKPGELVVECGKCCMKGMRGVVYLDKDGGLCVRWDVPEGKMGTSITWGTRRMTDVIE